MNVVCAICVSAYRKNWKKNAEADSHSQLPLFRLQSASNRYKSNTYTHIDNRREGGESSCVIIGFTL